MSPCAPNFEDSRVQLDSFIHGFLEQVFNHEDSTRQYSQDDVYDNSAARVLTAQKESAGAKSSTSRNGYRVQKSSQSRKTKKARDDRQRSSNDQSEDPDDGEFGDDGGDSEEEGETVAKLVCGASAHQQLSCPYRKRNPTRFNVRDHHRCALRGFADLALLK